MKLKSSWFICRCFHGLESFILFSFLLALMAQPIVDTIFNVTDIEYELCESYKEIDSEEREDSTDSLDEDPKYTNIFLPKFHSGYNLSFFSLQNDRVDSLLETPFPPPEWL